MRYLTSASVSFDVGHATEFPPACRLVHGHRATITIGCAGVPGRETGSYVIDPAILTEALRGIRAELECRDLGEMIAPAKPTAAGLAGWAWQRVALNLADALGFVEVTLGELTARVEA